MQDQHVTLIARFVARPGKEDELRQELQALVPKTRAEPGCVNYDLHEDPESSGHFMFHETFENAAAHQHHADQPYIQRLLQIADELCAEEPHITFWHMISEPE